VPTADRLNYALQNKNSFRPFGAGNWGQITYEIWNGHANYNSLQTLFRTKIKRADAQFAYTWSKSLSDSDITNSGDISAESAISDLSNPHLDYAPTLINRPHVFTSNVVYNLPQLQDKSSFVRTTLGGWEMATVLSYASGPSANIYSGNNVGSVPGGIAGTGYNNNVRPLAVAGQDCKGRGALKEQIFNPDAFTLNGYKVGTFSGIGRGVCRGPGIAQTDYSLYKNFKVGERMKAQFRLEFFNLFNKTQFRADKINNNLGNGGGTFDPLTNTVGWDASNRQTSFGQSSQTRQPREIQFALKFNF
jgi:hypothetical protein